MSPDRKIRLLAWNLNHRTHPRVVQPAVVRAIAGLRPDVVVLTEYVAGPSHAALTEELSAIGLVSSEVSTPSPGQNQVLIASRQGLEVGDLRAPAIDVAVPPNALHVRIPALGLEVLGMRIPDFGKTPRLRRACWDWLEEVAMDLRSRPFVILGDLNTDPRYSRSRCGDRFAALVAAGWQHALPVDGDSYWTPRGLGRKLDHAFVTAHFAVAGAEYVSEVGGSLLAGKRALSDHAALVVDLRELHGGASA